MHGIMLSPQRRARLARHLRDDLFGHRLDLGVGERSFARLQGHRDGDRFSALGNAGTFVDVEDANVGDETAVGGLGRLDHVGGFHRTVDDEGEIPLDRHEFGEFELFLHLGGLGLRRRKFVEDDLRRDERPLGAEGVENLRMQLAETCR